MPAATNYLISSDQFLSEIQRHMLETAIDGGVTWESGLWTVAEVRTYYFQRMSRFLQETGLIRARSTISGVGGTATYNLASTLLRLKRLDWSGVALPPSDLQTLDMGRPGWQTLSGTPDTYIEQPLPSLTIQLVPNPSSGATINVQSVEQPAAITGTPSFLPIPSLFTLHVKYGVMADMLKKEGEANDPQRSQYCEQRFQEGIELAQLLIGASA